MSVPVTSPKEVSEKLENEIDKLSEKKESCKEEEEERLLAEKRRQQDLDRSGAYTQKGEGSDHSDRASRRKRFQGKKS